MDCRCRFLLQQHFNRGISIKKKTKWIIFFLPVFVWVLVVGFFYIKSTNINRLILEADGLVIESGVKEFEVNVDKTFENELGTYVITITQSDQGVTFQETVILDYDLYGTGLVKAIQVDRDEEYEIVIWGNNFRKGEPFFLDLINGNIVKKHINELPYKAMEIIVDYKKLNTQAPLIVGLLIFITPVYYIIFFIVIIITRASGKTIK